MTSTANARELERLRQARAEAQQRFAKQMKLLDQIGTTAGEREAITRRWNAQLAALAELSGGASTAAELSGLSKADIEAAVKAADPGEVQAAVEAAKPATRRRRKSDVGGPSASSVSSAATEAASVGAASR